MVTALISPASAPLRGRLLPRPHDRVNAHDRTWLLTQSSDTRGQLLSEQLEVLNDPSSSTRRTFQADVHPSSPDISFCSPDLAIGARWEACLDLSLDHLPLVIDLHLSAPIQKKSSRTFFNFKKADRTSFSAQVEERLLDFDPTRYPSLDAAVGFFTRELLASSRNFIPVGFVRGNYPSVTHPFPGRLKVSCSNANISVLHLLRLLTSRGFTTSMRGLNPSLTSNSPGSSKMFWRQPTIELHLPNSES